MSTVEMETRKPRRHSLILAVGLSAIMAFSFAGASAGAAANRVVVKATLTGDKWKPVHTYIGKGTRVVWRNPAKSKRIHDVKSIGKNWSYSRVIRPGESVRRVFRNVGNYRFRCARHSAVVNGKCQGMCGVIHVFRN